MKVLLVNDPDSYDGAWQVWTDVESDSSGPASSGSTREEALENFRQYMAVVTYKWPDYEHGTQSFELVDFEPDDLSKVPLWTISGPDIPANRYVYGNYDEAKLMFEYLKNAGPYVNANGAQIIAIEREG